MITLVKVDVREEDIKTGSLKTPCDCPIAYAIMRAMNLPYRKVSVAKTIWISGCYNHITPPSWLEKWIITYDKGETVYPLTFYILMKKSPLDWEIIREVDNIKTDL